MTAHPDFELLMAYVDGELDAEQTASIEARLATDAHARETVEQLRSTNAWLSQGLDQILEEPVPQRLLDTVQGGAPDARVVPLRPRKTVVRPRTRIGLGWAAAAGIVLAIGAVSTISLLMPTAPPGSAIVDNAVLQEALETLPSGSLLIAGKDDASVMPLATYRLDDSRLCREFEVRRGTAVELGLACRDEDGRWAPDTLVEQEVAAAEADTERFVPAGGDEDPISTALDRMGAGAALVPAEERTLIDAGWSDRAP
ncbi:MAG: hypothetical protein K9M02_18150 [Thiohalocapsa sp.]|nr:hypothetical protein [Thiohalocapsa sp.]